MALTLEGRQYHNKKVIDDGEITALLGNGDFEIHNLFSLKRFGEVVPQMIYNNLIEKLKNSNKKYVRIDFIYRKNRSILTEFIDYKLGYTNELYI